MNPTRDVVSMPLLNVDIIRVTLFSSMVVGEATHQNCRIDHDILGLIIFTNLGACFTNANFDFNVHTLFPGLKKNV